MASLWAVEMSGKKFKDQPIVVCFSHAEAQEVIERMGPIAIANTAFAVREYVRKGDVE